MGRGAACSGDPEQLLRGQRGEDRFVATNYKSSSAIMSTVAPNDDELRSSGSPAASASALCSDSGMPAVTSFGGAPGSGIGM
jgi:hypothetical protein